MKNKIKVKSMLRIVGIIVITAAIGFTLSSCDLEAFLNMFARGSVTVNSTTGDNVLISVNNDAKSVYGYNTEYWYDLPLNQSLEITAISESGNTIATQTFTLTLDEDEKTFIFDGTSLYENSWWY